MAIYGKKFKVYTEGYKEDTEMVVYAAYDSYAAHGFVNYYDLPPNTEVVTVGEAEKVSKFTVVLVVDREGNPSLDVKGR